MGGENNKQRKTAALLRVLTILLHCRISPMNYLVLIICCKFSLHSNCDSPWDQTRRNANAVTIAPGRN